MAEGSVAEAIKDKMPVLRLWESPAFDNPNSWTVFVAPGFKYMVREVIGGKFGALGLRNYIIEAREDATFTPNTRVRDRQLSSEEFIKLELARPLKLSLIAYSKIGVLDGTIYGVQSWSDIRLTLDWIEDGPSEWREITSWATQTRQYLSGLLDIQDKAAKELS